MVNIVTDSSSDIPPSLADDLGITVIPANILFGRKKYVDGQDISAREFYEKLKEEYFHPITSPASPFTFYQAFQEISANDEDILVITLPESLSGFQVSARMAAEHMSNVEIHIYNSGGVSGYQGILTIQAAKLANIGYSADEIMTKLDNLKPKTNFFAVVPTFDSLIRGGRVPVAKGKMGALLGVFPLLTVKDEALISYATPKGFDQGFDIILHELKATYSRDELLICVILDAFNHMEAYKLKMMVEETFNVVEFIHSKVGATIGANAGEGAVAIALTSVLPELAY